MTEAAGATAGGSCVEAGAFGTSESADPQAAASSKAAQSNETRLTERSFDIMGSTRCERCTALGLRSNERRGDCQKRRVHSHLECPQMPCIVRSWRWSGERPGRRSRNRAGPAGPSAGFDTLRSNWKDLPGHAARGKARSRLSVFPASADRWNYESEGRFDRVASRFEDADLSTAGLWIAGLSCRHPTAKPLRVGNPAGRHERRKSGVSPPTNHWRSPLLANARKAVHRPSLDRESTARLPSCGSRGPNAGARSRADSSTTRRSPLRSAAASRSAM